MRLVIPLLLALAFLPECSVGQQPTILFRKVQVTKEYFAEGCGFGDFNKDGKRDLVVGPYWFAGPKFEERLSLIHI